MLIACWGPVDRRRERYCQVAVPLPLESKPIILENDLKPLNPQNWPNPDMFADLQPLRPKL